jgi:hypothetical protein
VTGTSRATSTTACAREYVADWSDERCEAYVREQVALAFVRAHRPIADDVVGSLGPRRAVEFLIEKRNAVCVRAHAAAEHLRAASIRVLVTISGEP